MSRLPMILSRSIRSSISHNQKLLPSLQHRFISQSSILYNSPFGKLTTDPNQQQPSPQQQESSQIQSTQKRPEIIKNEDGEIDISSITPENDEQLIEYHATEEIKNQKDSIEKLIHPLKIKLYNQVVRDHGFFKNDLIIKDEESKKLLKFHLTNEEISILEPSIYLQSFRIKLSMKKATIVNRFVRKMDLKTAINQLHFNSKKMSTELEKLLKTGLEKVRMLGYNENTIYIDKLWVGSDGKWKKRLDIKGRGRHGIIHHPYIHLKCVLKTEFTTKRLQWEKLQKSKLEKPKMYLNNDPLNLKVRPWYKW
ncbi:mrpl22 [Candida pseudojiufengensis]|uniref:mrpl22 n=1 Tax=Candida pseudojiufengensis TaxID=497109 RepID=UPI002225ACDE|nr:mrpl22 [Candida pseudojiufengensis]KAI5965629.1 mrpl22 [Candida pseudojiufengensis]